MNCDGRWSQRAVVGLVSLVCPSSGANAPSAEQESQVQAIHVVSIEIVSPAQQFKIGRAVLKRGSLDRTDSVHTDNPPRRYELESKGCG